MIVVFCDGDKIGLVPKSPKVFVCLFLFFFPSLGKSTKY